MNQLHKTPLMHVNHGKCMIPRVVFVLVSTAPRAHIMIPLRSSAESVILIV